MKFQKVYAEACEKKRAKEDIKREAELKLERAKKKEEKQAEKLRRYESYPLPKMYTLPFLKTLLNDFGSERFKSYTIVYSIQTKGCRFKIARKRFFSRRLKRIALID